MSASYWRTIAIDYFNLLQNMCLSAAAPGINSEVHRRDAERGRDTFRWFTPDEASVAEALARIIVPSDEETPGIDEVCVLGPPGIVTLDNLVAISAERQRLYSHGLLSFDIWAIREHGRKFVEMATEDQVALFTAAQQVHEGLTKQAFPVTKAWRRLRATAGAKTGSFYAARLYPQIRNDCLQVFYTSRVSWTWLGYDGPPMEKGYSSLVTPRDN
jgi:hypothetical protein